MVKVLSRLHRILGNITSLYSLDTIAPSITGVSTRNVTVYCQVTFLSGGKTAPLVTSPRLL